MGAKLKRKISEITTPANYKIPERRTLVSHSIQLKASAELISDLFCIGLKRDQATLGATTQRGVRSATLPLARRYRDDRVFCMRWLNAQFVTDTLFSDVKSLNQNTYAQFFSHKVGFNDIYPMVSSIGDSLVYSYRDFNHDFEIPVHLTFDGYSAQVVQICCL